MGTTSGSASTAIWLLMGCVTAAAPTGVAAQVQVDTATFDFATVAVNTSALTSLDSIAISPAIAPDLAARVALVAHTDPSADRSARLAGSDATEPALRQALMRTFWPADIVQRSDEYLRRYPDHAGAAEVLTQRRLASATAGLLRRNDVELFRAAFVAQSPDDPAVDDLRRAALGDADAAFKLAQQPQLQNTAFRRRVGWLQYAALLGNDRAAYALSLHYRRESQPLMAAQFEARALALGYQPPAALDNARK